MADESSLRARDVALAAGLSQRPPAVDAETRRSQSVTSMLRMFGYIAHSASGLDGGSSPDDVAPPGGNLASNDPASFAQRMSLRTPGASDSHPIMFKMPLVIPPGVQRDDFISEPVLGVSGQHRDVHVFEPATLGSSTGYVVPETDPDSTDSLPFASAPGNSSISPLPGADALSTEHSTGSESGGTSASPVGDSKSAEQPPITVQPTEILVEKLTAAAIERAAALAEKTAEMAIDRLREEMFVSQSARSALFPR